MSGPNAAMALPPDERPRAYQPDSATATPQQQHQLPLSAGAALEFGAIGRMLDDLQLAYADVKAGTADYGTFESRVHTFAALAAHFAKSVTHQRPRPPSRAQKE